MRNCPKCGSIMKTKETRQATQHPDWIRRRKWCLAGCGFKLTTIELPMSELSLDYTQGEDDGADTREES
jgi:transcriptional regulator NrdR family protein